jgi:SAM-dependent methyltransferase
VPRASSPPSRLGAARFAERAGAVNPYRDAALYDREYRGRRADVAFYRGLAGERGGPILDLGCGTGRLLIPLLRDGHPVVGVDLSPSMLSRAAGRKRRLAAPRRGAGLLLRADLRRLPVRGPFPLVIMAFHTIQHFVEDEELVTLLRAVSALMPRDGLFAFDVFHPAAAWLAHPARKRFDHMLFRDPATGANTEYSVSHRLDAERRALHITLHYRPVPAPGKRAGRGRRISLCHRQLHPDEVAALLRSAGLKIVARRGGFRDQPLVHAEDSEQHVYLVRRAR